MAEELELKYKVDRKEFLRCLENAEELFGGCGNGYVQVNYYFDSADFALSRAGSMLRVRQKNGSLKIQYKNKRRRVGDALLCDESEVETDVLPNHVDPSAVFGVLPAADCRLLGSLVTHRTDFAVNGAVISFDENFYLGKTDWEIEIEGDSEVISALAQRLSPRGAKTDGDGKYSRFLSAYFGFYGIDPNVSR